MGERELTDDVGGTTDGENGAVRQCEGRQGRGLGLKKGLREGKLHFCRSTPVQPLSAIRGEGEEGNERSNDGRRGVTQVRDSVGAVGVEVRVRLCIGKTSKGIGMGNARRESAAWGQGAVWRQNLVLSGWVRDGDRGRCRGGRQSYEETGP